MKKAFVLGGMSLALVLASMLSAQEPPEMPKPVKEHEWLNQFVGEWESETEGQAGPDGPAMHCKGTMKNRMLGGFWVVSEVTNVMDGQEMTAVQTIGYDTEKKKYVGTWIDSMFNHMWKYEGWVDESGKKLVLEAEGPNMMAPGQTAKYRDSYEFKSPDHIVVTSEMQGEDGKWTTFMTGNAKKKK